MNITDSFYNRDQSFAKVNLAMNYLSRLVRENMTVFDYNAYTGDITFLTDADKLVTGVMENKNGSVFIKDLAIENATDTFSNERIDERVSTRITDFVEDLKENAYPQAEENFAQLLSAFESRSKINEARSRLERRRARFTESQKIIDTPEYLKLIEIKDKIIEYLKENKETLLNYEDVVNSVKLTHALGKAFNLDRRDWDSLVEDKLVPIPYDSKKTVFEMICTQELIRSELSESKENFSRTWVKNPHISKLASCIYRDDSTVQSALEEAVRAVPYLALSSKADIKNVFTSLYEASDVANISQKDIREYVARIFEFKKPIKKSLIKELNESYGINVTNLKFVPTFTNLAKAQSVLFEALARLGDKETVVRDVFSDFAKTIHKKSGIQTLDVNEFIGDVFQAAGINSNSELFSEMNLDDVVEAVKAKDEFPEIKGKKEKNGDPKAFGGKKGDKSKTKKGEDFEEGDDEETEEDDEKSLSKDGKKMVKNGKNGKKGKGRSKADDKLYSDTSTFDEGQEEEIEYNEPEEDEQDFGSGLSDDQMTGLMGELETLFKEIDWDAIAEDDEEEDEDPGDGNDYSDEPTSREAPGGGDGEMETEESAPEEEAGPS